MPSFSPYGRISQVPVAQVFDAVRYLLFRWGFIPVFRADNGSPFGDPSRQALSPLNLHLIALGIRIKLNPPRSPVKNAKVERNQGTTARWADPINCADYLELQINLNQSVLDQRENYPTRTCQGKTRAEQYPELFQNPKRFHPDDFDCQRTYQQLQKGTWERKVSAQGVASLFAQNYQVGFKYRGTSVTATFDSQHLDWVFKNRRGEILKKCSAENLCAERILNFSTSQ
jgi:transposase InsO family protein